MDSPLISDAFWISLEQSGLVAVEQIAAAKDLVISQGVATAGEAAQLLVEQGLITRFQADRLLEGRSRGFFFDSYQVIDLVGVGGMGWVYQAVDTQTKDVVALKVLRDEFKHDSGMLARFQQEARVGLKLQHPHIVRTIALGSAGGLPYMTMDFVAGPNLLELLVQRRRLPWQQACDFARQAAWGLDYAHQAGIVHRDIKPQNLLIDASGRVRILDFGLSMFREGEAGDEFSLAMIFGHESVGTMDYSAPEQVKDSLAADARSDIFSLGGTLFAALTGMNPSQKDQPQKNGSPHPRTVKDFVPEVPVEVATIVARMLEKDPTRRFATASEAAVALSAWSQPAAVEFDFTAILNERKKFAQRRRSKIQSQSAAMGISRSTARLTGTSSVAKLSAASTAIGAATSEFSPRPVAHDTPVVFLRGPATKWVRETERQHRSHAALVVVNKGYRIPLLLDKILVGRGDDCELQPIDNAVSSHHCELSYDGRRWWIRDLDSRNGTRVNGAVVQRRALRNGDEIIIGTQERFRIEYEAPIAELLPSGGNVWIWVALGALVTAIAALAAAVMMWR